VKASEVETLPVGFLSRFQNSLQLSGMDISRGKKVGCQSLDLVPPLPLSPRYLGKGYLAVSYLKFRES
jgi:hypothetical protein